MNNPERKPHRLSLTLDSYGSVYGELVCPYGNSDDPGRPCTMLVPNPGPRPSKPEGEPPVVPEDGNPAHQAWLDYWADCDDYPEHVPDPEGGCVLVQWFEAEGVEIFQGSMALGTFDVDIDVEGWGEDAEVSVVPWKPSLEVVSGGGEKDA